MASEADNRASFEVQAGYCAAIDAPVTARVAQALGVVLDRTSATGRAVLDWPGEPVADALVLRLIGGLHALHRAAIDRDLSRLFAGLITHNDGVIGVLRAAIAKHDAALLPWLDGPPQTNEAGRSAGLMTGLLHLAARFGPRVELLEIGSSAGLNLVMDRFRFDLGGVSIAPPPFALSEVEGQEPAVEAGLRLRSGRTEVGSDAKPLRLRSGRTEVESDAQALRLRSGRTEGDLLIRPEWRGPPPPDVPVEIVSTRGVDLQPIDLADPVAAARLAAYCWVEAIERQARLAQAIALVRAHGVALDRGDAADWVEARLTEPQPAGMTRVLMHSVVWQYLPPAGRQRIRECVAAAGTRATGERPLGWVMMEPNRDLHRHEVRVQGWPGDRPMELVALTHAHGNWVEGLAPPYATRDTVMWRGAYE